MRRNYWVVVASALVISVLTGCSDTVVAPAAAPSVALSSAPTSTMLAPAGRPTLALSTTATSLQNGTTQFTVNPAGGVFYVGGHAVVFPAHSICDPAASSYGPTEWDKPCTVLNRKLTITATVRTVGGEKSVDFSPELRFVPSDKPARWVWIFINTPEARGASDLARFNILFAEYIGAPPVNDAASDPTLRTYVDPWLGVSYRRIKHFTGYYVNAGFTCDPNVEDCSGDDNGDGGGNQTP
jgi:hypothetical protein